MTESKSKSEQERSKTIKGAAVLIVTFFIITVVLLVSIPYYRIYLSPWNRTVIQVRDARVTMRDVIERLRLRLTGNEKNRFEIATSTIQELQNREIAKQEALKQNITVTEEEIDREVRGRVKASATGEGRFEDLYAAMLRGLRISDQSFREWVRYDLFQKKLFEHFLKEQPEEEEQVHVYAIITGTQGKAERIRDRLLKGEDFSELAKEASIDLASAKKGGDLGWLPKDIENLEVIGQVRAQGLMVGTEEEAEKMRERIVAGEDISRLARLNSIDDASRENEGELGWVSADYKSGPPYGVQAYELNPGEVTEPINAGEGYWIVKVLEKSPSGKLIDDIAFNLEAGHIPQPLKTIRGYYVLKVEAKEKSHPLSDKHRIILAQKTFDKWMAGQTKKGSDEGWIKWDWGSEAYNWINQHLD